ncbi:MAG: acyl-CoA synthetase [Acidimicrobiia bacterium]|nr:acyl-CoA synthetase [Acidimicrobiia bacterium]MBV9041407.1 acyl-CoA synthetase [Acidimicrobiia bacterium]
MDFNLADIFETIVDVVPDREAIVCEDDRLTYAELEEKANRLGHHLQEAGVQPGQHVGVQLYNSIEYLTTAVACLKIRAVPVNVNYRYVEEELSYLYNDADLVALVVHRELASRAAAVRTEKLKHVVLVDDDSGADLGGLDAVPWDEAILKGSPERGFGPRSGDDLYIIYTGGTTGMPKGVMWRQEDIFFSGMGGGDPAGRPAERPEQIAEQAAGRDPSATFPMAPLMHGAAQLASFICFHWGGKVVLQHKFEPKAALRLMEREKVNTVSLVGDAMARPLADALDEPDANYDLSSLIVISSAGAVFSDAVRDQLKEHLPNIFLVDAYGASETGHQGTMAAESSPEKGLRFTMNDNTTVLDDDLKPVEPGSGVVGRVALKGHVPLGYYNDPEKTATTFKEIDGQRWVLPGDMATIEADGTVLVFGRGSVCINSGGEKIYPEEVEAALKSHPDVFDAVVVGVKDEKWGERVTALVQARPGRTLDPDEVVAHCRTKVAGYKAPRQIYVLDELVRSPSGKADYPWARKTAAALSQ